tara:strand:+ start:4811 stop:5125 length:315 start_codon:yes stop_codon:yes gene_type:complete
MTSKSKLKGSRFERETNEIFNNAGFISKKIPLSGATWLKGDLLTTINKETLTVECKVRKSGFKQQYQWLESNDLLVCKEDRNEPIVILKLSKFIEILKGCLNNA